MMGGNTETLKELETTFKAISAPGRLFSCGDLGSSSTLKM
jgi:6-phosphogluconate dehydrogenase (decarboxylating)